MSTAQDNRYYREAGVEIFTDFEQGSELWLRARAGIVTASRFADVIAKGRGQEPSKVRRTYMLELAGEILTGRPAESFQTRYTERGHEMEPDARLQYVERYDVPVALCGFMRRGNIGASPDFLVGDDGLAEVKSRLPKFQIELLLAEKMPSEHYVQCQGQLLVSGRQFVDYISYWPGLPLYVKRIEPDAMWQEMLSTQLEIFSAELLLMVERLKEMQS